MDKNTHSQERLMVAEGCPNGIDNRYYNLDVVEIATWDSILVPRRGPWEFECTALFECKEVQPNVFEAIFPPIVGDIEVPSR